jgi:oligo-1,6-glucosidase
VNGPRLLEFLGEMKEEVLSKYDLITVGETPSVTINHAAALTDAENGPLNMVFQFEHMGLDHDPGSPYGRFSIGTAETHGTEGTHDPLAEGP